MKKGYWVAAVLALVFIALGVTAFNKTLTPYLTFDEARKARGVVQVMGGLDKESDRYDTAKQELRFDLLDSGGHRMPVAYRGSSPATSRTRSRSWRSAPTRTAASKPRSSSSSAPRSTRAPRSRSPTPPAPPNREPGPHL